MYIFPIFPLPPRPLPQVYFTDQKFETRRPKMPRDTPAWAQWEKAQWAREFPEAWENLEEPDPRGVGAASDSGTGSGSGSSYAPPLPTSRETIQKEKKNSE